MKSYIGYYTVLRGEVLYHERKPKNRMFVSETIERPDDEQHTRHTLTLHDACAQPIKSVVYDAWHGYGRGPGLRSVISKLMV